MSDFKPGDSVWIYKSPFKPIESFITNIKTYSSSLKIIDCFPGLFDDRIESVHEIYLYHRPLDKQKLINEMYLNIEDLKRYIEDIEDIED